MIKKSIEFYLNSFRGLSKDIWLLALIMLINRSGTMVIPFLTVYLTTQLEFTYAQAGIAMSCWGLGSVLGTYMGGWLTDKIGYYKVQVTSLFLSALVFFSLGYVHSFELFCISVMLLSVIADSFRPANLTAISSYSKPENYTRSLSLIRLAINMGFAAGPAVGGFIASKAGYDWLFRLNGISVILAGITLLIFLKEKTDSAQHSLEEEEVVGKRSPWRDRIFVAFLGFLLLSIIAFMQLLSTVPVFLKEQALLDESQIGLLLGLNGLLIALTEMPIIYAIEKRYNVLYLIVFGVALIAGGYVLFSFGTWIGWIVLAMILLTFGEIICFPFSNTFAVSRSGIRNRGKYMGLFAMMFSSSFVVSPVLGMNVANLFGWNSLWYMMIGCCTISGLGIYWLKDIVAREKEEILARQEGAMV
ncbi:MAG: MFS transporter [Bacteroidota bacterium]